MKHHSRPRLHQSYWPTRYCCRAKCWKVSPHRTAEKFSAACATANPEHTQTDGQPAAPVATTTQTPPIPLADNHAVNRKDME
ncbi:hypothetical protein MYA98_20765 [Salmonella sp. WGH-01]|nr:hypothetical protein MYA98_20765 [Salmonella sp. WGH-01]